MRPDREGLDRPAEKSALSNVVSVTVVRLSTLHERDSTRELGPRAQPAPTSSPALPDGPFQNFVRVPKQYKVCQRTDVEALKL